MKIARKIKNRRGFTLAETLMAVLILLMVAAIVAAGIPLAKEAYDKAVDAANAQTLLSTTMTMLRGELSEAKVVDKTATSLTYRSGKTGSSVTLCRGEDDDSAATNGIQLKDVTGDSRPLVTSEAATIRLHTTFDSVDYDDGIITITGLKVVKGDMELTSITPFTVKTVNP